MPAVFMDADRFAIEYDPRSPVAYCLIVERSEYRSNDLAELELKLYEYAIESEEITGDARDYGAAEFNPRLLTPVMPSNTA